MNREVIDLSNDNKLDISIKPGDVFKKEKKTEVKTIYDGNALQKFFHIGPKHYETVLKDQLVKVDFKYDLYLFVYNENRRLIKTVYYRNPIVDGIELDNENLKIKLDLLKLSKSIKYIMIGLKSYNSLPLDDIPFIDINVTSQNKKVFNKSEKNSKEFKNAETIFLGTITKKEENTWEYKYSFDTFRYIKKDLFD